MSPEDLHRKKNVLDGLGFLEQFFEKKFGQLSEYSNPPAEAVMATRQNKELCLQLIQECRKCDRLVDRVNKEIILLK
jgi:hypothetical protein